MFKKIAAVTMICLFAFSCESYAGLKSSVSNAAGKVKSKAGKAADKVKSDTQDLAHMAGVGKGSTSSQEKLEKEKAQAREATQNRLAANSIGSQQQQMREVAQRAKQAAAKQKAGK